MTPSVVRSFVLLMKFFFFWVFRHFQQFVLICRSYLFFLRHLFCRRGWSGFSKGQFYGILGPCIYFYCVSCIFFFCTGLVCCCSCLAVPSCSAVPCLTLLSKLFLLVSRVVLVVVSFFSPYVLSVSGMNPPLSPLFSCLRLIVFSSGVLMNFVVSAFSFVLIPECGFGRVTDFADFLLTASIWLECLKCAWVFDWVDSAFWSRVLISWFGAQFWLTSLLRLTLSIISSFEMNKLIESTANWSHRTHRIWS